MLTTIKEIATTINTLNVSQLINNALFDIKSVTDREKLLLAIFVEIKKAIDTETHVAILQQNYSCTSHADSNAFNLIRFVERNKEQNALTNIYITTKQNNVYCKLTVTAHKTYQDELAKHNYDIVKHCKTVELSQLTAELKTLYAILYTAQQNTQHTAQQSAQQSAKQSKADKSTAKQKTAQQSKAKHK